MLNHREDIVGSSSILGSRSLSEFASIIRPVSGQERGERGWQGWDFQCTWSSGIEVMNRRNFESGEVNSCEGIDFFHPYFFSRTHEQIWEYDGNLHLPASELVSLISSLLSFFFAHK